MNSSKNGTKGTGSVKIWVHGEGVPAPRYQLKTLRKFLEHIQSLGLRVYGLNVDLDTGEVLGGNRDYSAEEIVKLRVLVENDYVYFPEDM